MKARSISELFQPTLPLGTRYVNFVSLESTKMNGASYTWYFAHSFITERNRYAVFYITYTLFLVVSITYEQHENEQITTVLKHLHKLTNNVTSEAQPCAHTKNELWYTHSRTLFKANLLWKVTRSKTVAKPGMSSHLLDKGQPSASKSFICC